MNLREQEYMCIVAKLASISKAAEFLHISQPSLSQFVQRVEREFGYEIFDRSHKMLTLTREGEEYIRICSNIIQAEQELKRRIDDLSNLKSGYVSIGVSSQRSRYLMPDLLKKFLDQYPNIKLNIRETLTTDELEKLTLRRELDLFFSTLPLHKDGFDIEHIADDNLILALPSSIKIPFANGQISYKKFTSFLSSLSDVNFILHPYSMKLGRLSYKLFNDIDFQPKLFFETTNADLALGMVSRGLGATFIFRSAVNFFSTAVHSVQYIQVPSEKYTVPFVIGFAKNAYLSNAARAFIAMCKSLSNKYI